MKTPVSVELYYSAAWHDIADSDDVYTRDPITITRGRANESQRSAPSTLTATIENRDGKYSPRNPNSSLYGLIGRNTPIRVSVAGYDVVADTYTRVETAGWGTCEYGALPWSSTGAGGSVLSTDFTINGSQAIHTVTATSAFRFSWLPGLSLADVTTTCKFRFLDGTSSDVLGADVEPANMMLRVQDVNNYYMCRVELHADQTLTASLHVVGGAGSIGSATVSSLTYSGQWLRVKAQALGTTIRMKVWQDTDAEPASWSVTATDSAITAAGGVGIRSGVAASNTNTARTFYYDDFTLDTAYRFHGEIESWPQRWNTKGNDAWAPITANGLMRRLNAPGTTQPSQSPMFRAIIASDPLAYWSCEDAEGATSAGSALPSGTSMQVIGSGGVDFGTTTDTPAGSLPLPDNFLGTGFNSTVKGALFGLVPTSAVTTVWQVESIMRRTTNADAGSANKQMIAWTTPSTTVYNCYLEWVGTFTGQLEFNVYDIGGTFVTSITGITMDLDEFHHVAVKAVQNGGNVDFTVYLDGASAGTVSTAGTLTGTPNTVTVAPVQRQGHGPASVGHVAVHDTSTDLTTHYAAMLGHVGETAAARISRVCNQEGITLVIYGDSTASELLGVQRIVPVLEILQDAVDADQGILFEPTTFLGFGYRTGRSLYNQTPTLELDYSAGGEVAPPLEPVEDTDVTANDITVRRYQGGFARAIRESGPLNVSEPADDPEGVGRYAKEVTLVLYTDDQCQDQASWLRHLGTWDEARYPVANLDLTAMNVESKTALMSSALSLNIGDRFTIANTPAWLPPEDIEQHVQGSVETLASHQWTIAANATPALPYEIYTIGTETTGNRSRIPAARGQSTLNEALDTTETGVDVISVRKPWIDSAAFASQFPFDVMIGGERMTVTACAGTGLTQTFTVTRSVNGIVKSHASGTEVQLFHPPVLAL